MCLYVVYLPISFPRQRDFGYFTPVRNRCSIVMKKSHCATFQRSVGVCAWRVELYIAQRAFNICQCGEINQVKYPVIQVPRRDAACRETLSHLYIWVWVSRSRCWLVILLLPCNRPIITQETTARFRRDTAASLTRSAMLYCCALNRGEVPAEALRKRPSAWTHTAYRYVSRSCPRLC